MRAVCRPPSTSPPQCLSVRFQAPHPCASSCLPRCASPLCMLLLIPAPCARPSPTHQLLHWQAGRLKTRRRFVRWLQHLGGAAPVSGLAPTHKGRHLRRCHLLPGEPPFLRRYRHLVPLRRYRTVVTQVLAICTHRRPHWSHGEKPHFKEIQVPRGIT